MATLADLIITVIKRKEKEMEGMNKEDYGFYFKGAYCIKNAIVGGASPEQIAFVLCQTYEYEQLVLAKDLLDVVYVWTHGHTFDWEAFKKEQTRKSKIINEILGQKII